MVRKKKMPKNRLARSAKYSEYKLGKLLECFASDLGVKQAATLTKMTERTVRDRYAEWRGKLLGWAIGEPDRFSGFGHLLLDSDDNISPEVLAVLIHLSRTPAFKRRMAVRYPKFRTEKQPALEHVVEFVIRSFTAFEPPVVNDTFKREVDTIVTASRAESFLLAASGMLDTRHIQSHYWGSAMRRFRAQVRNKGRRFPDNAGEGLFRDLRYFLRWETTKSCNKPGFGYWPRRD
ncbi:Uncharacterised protein [Halioglobus japonicus]|nr:Uncharacterised protein [Halioglobus japonicus]